MVGTFPLVSPGETLKAEGEYIVHSVYGKQFKAVSFTVMPPEGTDAIERYLAGGAIKGIGPAMARRIVKKFKEDTFRIMEEEPERLAEIKGISELGAMRISEQASAKRGMRDAAMFMQQYGISAGLANKIYEKYGPSVYTILKSNPYRLADEIEGIGFKTADRIAARMGIEPDSKFRVRCGIIYCLADAAADGHTYLPKGLLLRSARDLLELDLEDIDGFLRELQVEGQIVVIEKRDSAGTRQAGAGKTAGDAAPETGDKPDAEAEPDYEVKPESAPEEDPERDADRDGDRDCVYLSAYYYTESDISFRLREIAAKGRSDKARVEGRVAEIEAETGIILDAKQKEAIKSSVENGVLILTGGPGTGKTTTINSLIKYYQKDHKHILLAAPTGRAAKRMTEMTGYEAQTIHRMLEYTGVPTEGNAPGDTANYEGTYQGPGAAPYGGGGNAGGAGSTSGKGRFMRDEKDPLEADVIIIDEMSMVDIFLMDALLKAVVPGTRLILTGDKDQLPSVGAGNVLRDLIDSGAFKTVRLEHVFRQAARSDIILNAHRINNGEPVDLTRKSRDFLFIRAGSPEEIKSAVKKLIVEKLPVYVNCESFEIQVLTPVKRGALGVENLNRELQHFLNPPDEDKKEMIRGEVTFRTGDKVMQTKNDYDLEWTVYDEAGMTKDAGSGVFNGDIGYVADIDEIAETVTIVYDDEKHVVYDRKQIVNVVLAYAVTVHKSQGSEYPAVIMPMFRGPRALMNRNLLYTAVTRARKCVVMVGSPSAFEEMEKNENENKRYSGLCDRIRERYNLSG